MRIIGRASLALLLAASGPIGCGRAAEQAPSGTEDPSSSREAAQSQLSNPGYVEFRDKTRKLVSQGRLSEARGWAEAAVSLAPLAREPYDTLSRIHVRLGDDQRAIEFFTRATREYPDSPHAWSYKGSHEFRADRWDTAVASFRAALQLDDADPQTWARLAKVLHSRGEFEPAAEAWGRAHALVPAATEISASYGRALRILGRYDDAERVIETALEGSPDSGELRYALGQLRLRQGRETEAEAELRQAIAAAPALPGAYADLAGLLERQGRPEEARAYRATYRRLRDLERYRDFLNRRVGLLPDDPRLSLLLAELGLTGGDVSGAMGWFARAEQQGGPADRVAAGRAYALFFAGRRDAGEAELRKIVDSEAPRALLARAAQQVLSGDSAGAAELVADAIRQGPAEKDFLYRAADLYGYLGREAEALDTSLLAGESPYAEAPTSAPSMEATR